MNQNLQIYNYIINDIKVSLKLKEVLTNSNKNTMYDYKTKWNDKSNNFWLVMNEETEGWEFMQIVPSSQGEGYDYWFRRPMMVKKKYDPESRRLIRASN